MISFKILILLTVISIINFSDSNNEDGGNKNNLYTIYIFIKI